MEIWTEKYRPKEFEDVVGQEEIVKRIRAMVESRNLPHLLFAGPAGVGKTTLSLIIAKKLYGDKWRENFLELNASDERGIDVIRNKVKDFARTKPLGNVDFKLIFLDEADALTKEAQQALRRTMESFSNICRFILSCNYSSKIISPIQSRCAVFRFKPLSDEDILKLISKIAKEEKVKISKEALKKIAEISDGDARRAINILQAVAILNKEVTIKDIYEIAGIAREEEIEKMLDKVFTGKIKESSEELIKLMFRYGLSSVDMLKVLNKYIIKSKFPDLMKIELIDKLAEYEFRIVEGSDEYLQLEALLAQFYYIAKKYKK